LSLMGGWSPSSLVVLANFFSGLSGSGACSGESGVFLFSPCLGIPFSFLAAPDLAEEAVDPPLDEDGDSPASSVSAFPFKSPILGGFTRSCGKASAPKIVDSLASVGSLKDLWLDSRGVSRGVNISLPCSISCLREGFSSEVVCIQCNGEPMSLFTGVEAFLW
jgi:hypothetical protein